MTSDYHIQINPSTHNIYDRNIIALLIEEILRYYSLSKAPYRIIVIEDADDLSVEAQEYLRRTLETYIKTCRFIFLNNKRGYLIKPLYSRCLLIRLARPDRAQICSMLDQQPSEACLDDLLSHTKRDLSQVFQYYHLHKLSGKSIGDLDHVRSKCAHIVFNMTQKKSLDAIITDIRKDIYELITHCIDSRLIIPMILNHLLARTKHANYDVRYRLTDIATKCDDTLRISSKAIYHLEAFCLHALKIIYVK